MPRSHINLLPALLLASLMTAMVTSAFAGNTNACYSIKDSSRRNACIAEMKGSRSDCASVRDHDKRAMCDAKVSGNKSNCASIRNSDQRNACMAGMGW